MKSILLSLSIIFFTVGTLFSQNQPIDKPAKGYRFQYRIKGPEFKKSEVLELMVDEYGNYLVATFRGEKSSYVYLIIYNLYSWDEKYKIKLDDNRCELYNSTFDESGDFFYVNYDIYRNMFKEINLKTGEIRKVDCSATPKGCRKIESQFYKLDAYTIGDNYYIYRDEKFENYIKILVKKEMYIPKVDEETVSANYGLKNALYVDPKNGGVIQVTPEDLRNLKAGIEVTKNGVPIFYDANAVDAAGNIVPYAPAEGEPFKIRFTTNEIKKLDKKISFVYQNFVIKLDLEALEAEKSKQ
ncbi:MAG: hypothetical protein M0P66_06080 [Salinivirgaceae bacterium]|nr:hypothetical protein [Salinivirgaceae bacterium]